MLSSSTKSTPQVQNITVPEDVVGQRLDNFLITRLKGVPRTRIYRLIRKGEVRINKGRIKPDYRIQRGDLVRIPPIRMGEGDKIPMVSDGKATLLSNAILYEDEGLLVINKPAGMAVHGGSGVSLGVIEALRCMRGEKQTLELVHRLDRDTSGCLLIAKRRSTLKAIHELFQSGKVKKIYWTLVKGQWQGGSLVNAALEKNQLQSGERMVRVSNEGQKSLTAFRVLKTYKDQDATLMEAEPLTGRTHQIRVHAEHVGNPIAGDPKYGDNDFNKKMKAYGLTRLFLHAKRISLQLPGSEKVLTIEAPLDPKLSETLERLS